MTFAAEAPNISFPPRHLLGIEGLSRAEITGLLDLSEEAAKLSRQIAKKRDDLRGRTLINLFFEASTRTQSSFELAGKRLGAVELLSQKVDCSVINAGDGSHEHPTQALLDALTIRRHKGDIEGLIVAICGDILHSRVARSNILLLNALGARVRVIAPSTLLASGIERLGVEVFTDMR